MNDITQTTVRQMTAGQLKDLCTLAVQAVPQDATFEVASDVLGHKTDFINHVLAFFPNPMDLVDPVKLWESFYQKVFNLTVNLSGVKIPERTAKQKREFTRLIIVACGLTQNQVYKACEDRFPCYRYAQDLDTAIPTNEREPKNGSYAIWVCDTVEADKIHRNKSADMIREEGLKTETLLERMLHELKFFTETSKHLDVNNVTLCSGSRRSDGDVPGGGWNGDEFGVGWYGADDRDVYLRPREVIS